MKYLKYILVLFLSIQISAQNFDSLWKVYTNKKEADTNRLKAIYDIAWSYIYSNPDTAIILGQEQLQLAQKSNQKKYEGIALKTIGVSYLNKDNAQIALEYLLKALKINEEIGDKQGIGSCSNNIGAVYQYQSNYTKALAYYLKCLKISEERGDKTWIGASYGNIGLVYSNQHDYKNALDFHFKALKISQEIGNAQAVGTCYNNIGIVYISKTDYVKALEYQLKALKISEERGDKSAVGGCYINIGTIYMEKSNYSKALEYDLKSLSIKKEIEDKQGIGLCYNTLAELYNKLKNYKLAIRYEDSSLQIAKEILDINLERETYQNLSVSYSKTNDYKTAFNYHEKFVALTDSIFNVDNSKQLGDLKTNFEVEKRETELKAMAKTQQTISNEEKKRQQLIIYTGMAMFVIVVIFAGFMLNRVKVTQKQKQVIERQKHLVEESQKEIIDSITYAQRIQQVLLTPEKYIGNYVKEFFILFKPKDIVSGDFYWAANIKNRFYLATADCTGHGVPGAFMSMLGINFLNEIMIEKGITRPNEVLNTLRTEIIAALNPEGSAVESKDGMDMSLCCFDFSNNTLEFALANNGIYIVRKNEVIELKPDKMPVGKYTDKVNPFTYNKIQLQQGDVVYTYTDGYADQFGGPKGKKFNYRQVKELLISISNQSLQNQKEILSTNFNTWKGSLDQVDDVCLIGVKV